MTNYCATLIVTTKSSDHTLIFFKSEFSLFFVCSYTYFSKSSDYTNLSTHVRTGHKCCTFVRVRFRVTTLN